MLGVIKNYDPETQTGTLTTGKENFNFDISVWIADAPPEQGDEVTFELAGVKPFKINLYGATLNKGEAVKYKYVAAVLALFFGSLGAHRLYLGFYRIAVIQIISTTLLVVMGLPGYAFLWGFVETILLFGGQIDKDAEGRLFK